MVVLPPALFLAPQLSSQLIIATTLTPLSPTPPATALNVQRKNARGNLRVPPTPSPPTIASIPMVAPIVRVVCAMTSASTLYSTADMAGPRVLMASVAFVIRLIPTPLIAAVLVQTLKLAVMGVS